MKKTIILSVLVSLFLFTGCNYSPDTIAPDLDQKPIDKFSNWETWDRNGLYMRYPSTMIASESDTGDIVVKKSNISEIVEKCRKVFEDRTLPEDNYFAERNSKDIESALNNLKIEGLSYDNSALIKRLELDTCRAEGENISVEPIKVSNANGVIFIKALGQDLPYYFIQTLIVTKNDDVYTITFNPSYNLSEVALKLIKTDQVNLEYKKALMERTDIAWPGFQNLKINLVDIDKIVSSLSIKNNY